MGSLTRTSILLAAVALLGGAAAAQLAAYDAGDEGNPTAAPDPTTQDWILHEGGASNTLLTDVSPDGSTGVNAWAVDDLFTDGGSWADYRHLFTAEELALAQIRGWEYTTRMRMVHSTGVDVVFEFASGQQAADDRYLIFFEVAGNDVLAHAYLSGIAYTCSGAMDGNYHELQLRKLPGSTGDEAELYYDGQFLGPVPAEASSGNAPDGGVSWGTGSSAGMGGAYFHSVDFKLSDPTEPELIDVFTSGDGYPSYRIPSILTTASGTILALAEGRAYFSDHARNDIVMRRSTDGGTTWGPLVVLHDDGDNSLNDPCAMQVLQGRNAGRILVVYDRYPNGCHADCVVPGYDGDNICRAFIQHSDDDGLTWSAPVEITEQVKRPTIATSIASGPGVGIQKRRPPHAGRMIIPYNQGPGGEWKVYAAFSDDGGDSWAWGELADDSATPGVANEVQMVELTDGSLLLNARSFFGTSHRKIAHSFDGGLTWTPVTDELQLIEPGVMASTLRHTDPLDGFIARLLYSGPLSTSARVDGTIHLSYDEGVTWPVAKLLYEGPFAYSVLTVLPDQRIGCLFERDNYSSITLARFSIEWLTDGADCIGSGAEGYCTTSPNSAGSGALISSQGSFRISDNDFHLEVVNGVPQQHGIFFYSDTANSVPFGDGVLCVGHGSTGVHRLPVLQMDFLGDANLQLDFPSLTGSDVIEPGASYYFQFWYRDPGGPGGSGFNLSDALTAGFCP
ncbi:MAG: sialidase family protein [Planctomycetota bacterium]|nr:hypothetical protein [Planctomycetota bacterium]MDP6385290.1 sialidase family protein [Planctomycetota bacterium]